MMPVFIFLCIAITAFADIVPLKTEITGKWRKDGELFTRTTEDAKADWSYLGLSVEIATDRYYCISLKAKSSAGFPDNLLDLESKWEDRFQCTHEQSYPLNPEWSECFFYFYSGQISGEVDFKLCCTGPFAQQVIIKEIKIFEQPGHAGNLLPHGGFSKEDKYPPLFKLKCGQGQPGALTCTEDETSITGESMQLQPGAGENTISSISLPVIPGRKYKMELWAKATQEIRSRIIVSDWFNPHRSKSSLSQSEEIKILLEWKKFSLEMSVPDDLKAYQDLQARMVKIIIKTTPGAVVQWFSGINFSVIDGK